MRILIAAIIIILGLSNMALAKDIVIKGFETPESAFVYNGDYYVSNIGKFGQAGDGSIRVIHDDEIMIQGNLNFKKIAHNYKVSILTTGLNDPKGTWIQNDKLYVADKTMVWEIELKGKERGKKSVYADKFPVQPKFLNDLVGDEKGNLYVSDTGEFDKADGYIFKIDTNRKVSVFSDYTQCKDLVDPNGLIFNNVGDLLVVDMHNGKLIEFSADGSNFVVQAEGFNGGDGLAYDKAGNLYISTWGENNSSTIHKYDTSGKISVLQKSTKPSADITVDKERNVLVIPEFYANSIRISHL